MKCIVVDDEKIILEALETAVGMAGASVAGAYQDPLEALNGIRDLHPDVVFLDVEMPGMNGIELAERISALDTDIQIVFVTAYEQYAIKAYELGAIYYVLKPVTPEKIAKALTRAMRVQTMRRTIGAVDNPVLVGSPAGMADKLSVKVRDDIVILKMQDILFIKAENGKTVLYTKDGNYTSRSGIGFWERKLQTSGFIRCHRGYIVNTSYIKKLSHIMGEYLELVLSYCDANIPVSRQRAAAVKQWLGIQ